jgi:replicative DNA helicase
MQPEIAHKRERITNITTMPGIASEIANHTAEDAVIGGILQNPDLYLTLGELVEAGDFDQSFNGFVWYAFEEIHASNTAIDLVTVANTLLKHKEALALDQPKIIERLGMLMGSTPKAGNIQHHAQIVREAGQRLRIDRAANRIKTKLREKQITNDELIDFADVELSKASETLSLQKSSAADRMDNYIDTLKSRMNGKSTNILTGFHNLDTHNGGLFPNRLSIFVGLSGSGKSTWALSMIRNVCKAGKRVVLFTLEMTADDIMQELTTMETGIWRSKLRTGDLSRTDWELFIKASAEMRQWKLEVLDRLPRNSPAAIRRNLRRLQKQGSIDLVVIDGLWLTEDDDVVGDREDWQVLQRNTRKFSRMAKDFGLPIFLLHQYSGERKNADTPTLDMLMGGQGIHNDPDEIYALWRKKDQAKTLVYHLKQRGGVVSKKPFEFFYDTTYSCYVVWEDTEDVSF